MFLNKREYNILITALEQFKNSADERIQKFSIIKNLDPDIEIENLDTLDFKISIDALDQCEKRILKQKSAFINTQDDHTEKNMIIKHFNETLQIINSMRKNLYLEIDKL